MYELLCQGSNIRESLQNPTTARQKCRTKNATGDRFRNTRSSIQLRITQEIIVLTWNLFGLKYNYPRPELRRNIDRLTYIAKHSKRDSDGDRIQVPAQLVIRAGVQEFQLGGIGSEIHHEAELEWIADELGEWLGLPITRQ